MSFWLYEYEDAGKESLLYKRMDRVSLAGKHGPIKDLVSDRYRETGTTPLDWHITEQDLLYELGSSFDPHALVVDLKPRIKSNVSLYQIKDMWGFSYAEWTPIMIRLATVYADRQEASPEEFKKEFRLNDIDKERIHEFLYLRGGTTSGSWTWGPVGAVNGVLLWPDAMEYFLSVISTK